MGANLYAQGCKVSVGQFLGSAQEQDDALSRFLVAAVPTLDMSAVMAGDAIAIRQLARAYNGPGNVDAYAERLDEVRKAMV